MQPVVPALDFAGNPSHRASYLVQAQLNGLGLGSDDFTMVKTDSLVQVRDTGPIFVQSPSADLRIAEYPHALQRITEHYVGAGIGGHVDAFVRFVDASTVLLAYPDSAEAAGDPVKRITRARMQEKEARLRAARDQDG